MAEYISYHLVLRGVLIPGVIATSLILGGCAVGTDTAMPSQSGSSTPETSQTPASRPSVAPTPSSADASGLDADAAVESCVATRAWPDYGITVGDTAASQVVQRTIDDLLFVTIPAQTEAQSSSGPVQLSGSIYCYLDPTTLEPLRHAVGNVELIAHGFQIDLVGDQYQDFLAAPDPLGFIYAD